MMTSYLRVYFIRAVMLNEQMETVLYRISVLLSASNILLLHFQDKSYGVMEAAAFLPAQKISLAV